MKSNLCIFFILMLSACSGDKTEKAVEVSEDQKRKYFIDSFAFAYGFGYYDTDSARSFATFFKKHYPNVHALNTHDAFPYALEEEYIDTANIDKTGQWFRIIVTQPFRLPYAIKTENKYGKTYLTAKFTNGDGGYYTGTLTGSVSFPVSDSLKDRVFHTLDSVNFWEQPRFISQGKYMHPELWVIEAIDKGRYKYVVRHLPDMKKDEKLLPLVRQVLDLKERTRITQVINAVSPPENN